MRLRTVAPLVCAAALLTACGTDNPPEVVTGTTPAGTSSTAPSSPAASTPAASSPAASSPAASSPAASSPAASSPAASSAAPSPSTQEQALAQAYDRYVEKTAPANTPAVTGAVGSKPAIAKPQGAVPAKMVVKDLVVGKGKTAPLDSNITIDYVGISWDDGKEFDTSFGNEPASFSLANLIPGWRIGVPGMKEGGRRELVIPAELAYGTKAQGSSHQLADKTLVFVIDLKKVG